MWSNGESIFNYNSKNLKAKRDATSTKINKFAEFFAIFMKLKDYNLKLIQELYRDDQATFSDKLSNLLKDMGLSSFLEDLGEQVLAYISSSYKFSNIPSIYLGTNVKSDWDKGLHKLLTKANRSKLTKTKLTDKKILPYCSLVPMYMAAHKKYDGTAYVNWERDGLEHLVDEQLYKAMTVAIDHPCRQEDLDSRLAAREIALKGGTPATAYRLYTSPEPFKNLPTLAKHMLFQTWCAHPVNRNNYMILNPWDWDDMPKPLIEVSVIEECGTRPHSQNPWDT
jgi:hypothetical protein